MGAWEHLPVLYKETFETELSATHIGLDTPCFLRGAFLMIITANHFQDWKRRMQTKEKGGIILVQNKVLISQFSSWKTWGNNSSFLCISLPLQWLKPESILEAKLGWTRERRWYGPILL